MRGRQEEEEELKKKGVLKRVIEEGEYIWEGEGVTEEGVVDQEERKGKAYKEKGEEYISLWSLLALQTIQTNKLNIFLNI